MPPRYQAMNAKSLLTKVTETTDDTSRMLRYLVTMINKGVKRVREDGSSAPMPPPSAPEARWANPLPSSPEARWANPPPSNRDVAGSSAPMPPPSAPEARWATELPSSRDVAGSSDQQPLPHPLIVGVPSYTPQGNGAYARFFTLVRSENTAGARVWEADEEMVIGTLKGLLVDRSTTYSGDTASWEVRAMAKLSYMYIWPSTPRPMTIVESLSRLLMSLRSVRLGKDAGVKSLSAEIVSVLDDLGLKNQIWTYFQNNQHKIWSESITGQVKERSDAAAAAAAAAADAADAGAAAAAAGDAGAGADLLLSAAAAAAATAAATAAAAAAANEF